MRSPFNTPQNQFPNPKPTNPAPPSTANNFTIFASPQFGYEPTSVLELRRSPSPVHGGSDSLNNFAAISGVSDDSPLPWDDDHVAALPQPPPPQHLLSSDDWESMMLGLPEKDDSVNLESSLDPSGNPQFLVNSFDQNNNSNSFNVYSSNQLQSTQLEFNSLVMDDLIRAAVCVESNDSSSAQVILARLNQLSPVGKPLQRSAFYFKEALVSLLSGPVYAAGTRVSSVEIVNKIKAYKSFSEVSPVTMFANFTANQTLLEALDGAVSIHIIDFEIGIGGQWSSFMQEIAGKAKSRNAVPSLRITAIITEESNIEAALISENLLQFAQELGMRLQLDFIPFADFQAVLFNAVSFIHGESVAVNLSPKIFRHLRTAELIAQFLRFLRRLAPRVTVFVDSEGSGSGSLESSRGVSFHRKFLDGMEFYSSLFESLDAAAGAGADVVSRIERYLIRPRIIAGVTAAASCVLPWRDLFSSAGMAQVQFSEFTESQAEWVVRRTHVRGFHVEKRHGSKLLCWNGRELVATSAWRC